MGRGKRPHGRSGLGGRSLTTRVTLFVLDASFPTIDYDVAHILDTDDVLGYDDDGVGATFCGAYPGDFDPDFGLLGTDDDIVPGYPVCPDCVQVALELQEERSIYLDATSWEPFVWDDEGERWVVGRLVVSCQPMPPQPPQVRGRPLRDVAED